MSNEDLERERLELEKQKLELEKQKLTNSNKYVDSSRGRELSGIRTAAIWSIVGWLLFIFPGLIATIILFVKLLVYKSTDENSGFKTASAIITFFFSIIGAIMALVFVSKEKEILGIY